MLLVVEFNLNIDRVSPGNRVMIKGWCGDHPFIFKVTVGKIVYFLNSPYNTRIPALIKAYFIDVLLQ